MCIYSFVLSLLWCLWLGIKRWYSRCFFLLLSLSSHKWPLKTKFYLLDLDKWLMIKFDEWIFLPLVLLSFNRDFRWCWSDNGAWIIGSHVGSLFQATQTIRRNDHNVWWRCWHRIIFSHFKGGHRVSISCSTHILFHSFRPLWKRTPRSQFIKNEEVQ